MSILYLYSYSSQNRTVTLYCTTTALIFTGAEAQDVARSPIVVKKKAPVAFSLSTLRNMICAVLGCCGTEQNFNRRLGFGTVRNLLVSVGF